MSYRILVLDLDGTLTNSQKIITPATLNALQRAQDKGVVIVLASGRPTYGIAPLADQLELDRRGGFVLSFNGGQIIDWRTKETIYKQSLHPSLPPRLYQWAQAEGLPIVTYHNEVILSERNDDPYLEEEAFINKMPIRVIDNFLEAIENIGGSPTKCLMTGAPERLIELEPRMKADLGEEMEIFRSAPFFLELMPKGIDKALSLSRLLEHLGIAREESIACGDGYNDLSMIRFAGLGVAMANAEEAVKNEADHITLSNEEDGVAAVIEQFILAG